MSRLELKRVNSNNIKPLEFSQELIEFEAKKFSPQIVSEFMEKYNVDESTARKDLAEMYLYQEYGHLLKTNQSN